MKVTDYFLISIFGLAAFWGCKKDNDPNPGSTPSKSQFIHAEFVDHTTGELVKGLELLFGRFSDVIADPDNFVTSESRLADASGSTNFVQSLRPSFIKPNGDDYADITYLIDGIEPYNGDVLPFKKCKLIRIQDGVSYYRADLYRKVPVDIHLKQITEISPFDAMVRVLCSGEDPTDSLSKFYMQKLFEFDGSLQVAQGKKIDTVFRVYAYGDLENTLYWSVYMQAPNSLDYEKIDEYWYNGSIEKNKYPLPGPASITIQF